jgi:hypothetical protein
MLALLEVLDRDGQVRQSLAVTGWPVQVGRALDNHLVLDDPHVAPHHLTVDADAQGAEFVQVGDTRNGLLADGRHLAAGARAPVGDAALRLDLGDLHLRLRLARHALVPELPLQGSRRLWVEITPIVLAGVLALALLLWETWLDSDPETLLTSLGRVLMISIGASLGWCSAWALLSKLFTRRSHVRWHVWVFLLAFVASVLLDGASKLLAFALSWPALTDYGFVIALCLLAVLLYFHVLGLEPRRPQRLRALALGGLVIGIGLNLWFNQQSHGRLGEELYMSHLFPPALRLAEPVDAADFVRALAPMQARLDEKASRDETGDDRGGDEE